MLLLGQFSSNLLIYFVKITKIDQVIHNLYDIFLETLTIKFVISRYSLVQRIIKIDYEVENQFKFRVSLKEMLYRMLEK